VISILKRRQSWEDVIEGRDISMMRRFRKERGERLVVQRHIADHMFVDVVGQWQCKMFLKSRL
jgi:hypothetical protein